MPRGGRVPEPAPAIMELCAQHDVAFDCAHGSGYALEEIAALAHLGAHIEFSFFALTHATQVGLTHADSEKHRIAGACTIQEMASRIRVAGARTVLSSDAGLGMLPPPVEALREFPLMLLSEGFAEPDLPRMTRDDSARLFGIAL